jgi:excisionase family DNA binding protein
LSHTVDEVSELLDVPRPTLYRYLKEYSIPHIRRSGKIYIPEESFDRIKEVRGLHKEGLGTESVRRRLKEESSDLDVEGITERLDRISEALCNLTVMLEDLLAANGRPRMAAFGDPEEETWQQKTSFEQLEGHSETTENDPVINEPIVETLPDPTEPITVPARHRRFGALARRRRRGVLVVLMTLLTSTALTTAVALSGEESPEASQKESPASSQEATPTRSEEVDARDQDAASSDPADYDSEGFAMYDEEGYEDFAPEQPSYQVQDAMPEPLPGPFPQEEPLPQEYPWPLPTSTDNPLP